MNHVITMVPGGWTGFILLVLAVGGILVALAVVLTGKHIPPDSRQAEANRMVDVVRRCDKASAPAPETDDSYAAARRFTCPKCDDRQPGADCICIGDCGRRRCKWATMHGGEISPEDVFNAKVVQLHRELDAAERE
jgi:hypothetical protein